MNKTQLIQLLTPIAVPIIVALAKVGIPKIPKAALPVLCPILGALIDVIASGTVGTGTAYGAALGAAGVGVREVYDQILGDEAKKRNAITFNTSPKP